LRQNLASIVSQRIPEYIDESLFHARLSEVFIADLANLRRADLFSGHLARCQMHWTDVFQALRSLRDTDVMVVTFPAHRTTIVQALDLVFCGALNKLIATAQGEGGEDSATDVIITKFIRGWQQTVTSIPVRGSCPPAELVPDTSVRRFTLTIEEDKMRENKGFREVVDSYIQIEEMSRRREAHRSEMMSQEFGTE
jgi:hypothetical protein